MAGIKFSIPYNGDIELMRWAISTGQVYEVYWGGIQGVDFSSKTFRSPRVSLKDAGRLFSLCREQGVSCNLLINKSILVFDDLKNLFSQIRMFKQMGGAASVTVADRRVIPYLKKTFPGIRVQCSVYLHVDTAEKLKEALKMGVDDFCLDVSVNRNKAELLRIRNLKKDFPGFTVKLLANHGCYQNCFFAGAHEHWDDLQAMAGLFRGKNAGRACGSLLPVKGCMYKADQLMDEIRRPFIRPEDVGFYEKNHLADYIKVGHRVDSSVHLRRKLEAYFNRKWDGDLFEVVLTHRPWRCLNKNFPRDFVSRVTSCRSDCVRCGYCEDVAALVLRKKGRNIIV